MKTLKDVLPDEFEKNFYNDQAYKYKDIEVEKEFFGEKSERWPGKHKNVNYWCLLKNGKAVGWNENPATGWSFPVMKYKSIKK